MRGKVRGVGNGVSGMDERAGRGSEGREGRD